MMGAAFAWRRAVETAELHEQEYETEHTPLGHSGDHARQELIGFYLYLVSMAAFLAWLLIFGVNV